ncbi:MAG: hypothetical protein NW226_11450 [Microscillaceae bacterium]|nr:hypothetical protein [Microscillaceae bacterium]
MFKKLLFLLVLFCFCFTNFCLAQDDDFPFQFTYQTQDKTYTFGLSMLSLDSKDLNKKVLNAFRENQKKSKSTTTELYWGITKRIENTQKQRYYCLMESELDLIHLYNDKAEWLYTIKGATNYGLDTLNQNTIFEASIDAKIKNLIQAYKDLESGDFARMPPYRSYSMESANGKKYYLIDIDSPLKQDGKYQRPLIAQANEFGITVLRLLLDRKMNVIQEFMLYGDSSELFELHLNAPIFFK